MAFKLHCACGKSHEELKKKIYSPKNTKNFLKFALKEQAEKIFKDLEKEITLEIKRLKKYDDDNWKKGNKEDGRKSTASILTLGINGRNIIDKVKKRWVKK